MAKRGSSFQRSVPMLARITGSPLFATMEHLGHAIPMADSTPDKILEWVEPTQYKLVGRLLRRLQNSGRYHQAMLKGGNKYNLNNLPEGKVSDDNIQWARRITAGRSKQGSLRDPRLRR